MCGTEYRWFAIKTKVLLPPIPTHIVFTLRRLVWGCRLWVEVFLLQAWDGLKWKVIPASHPSWTRNWMQSHLLFGNKINKQQFSLARLERGRENVENSSETMSWRGMVSLQSSEHFDLTFMVFSRWRFLQNRGLDKEKNTLRHHRAFPRSILWQTIALNQSAREKSPSCWNKYIQECFKKYRLVSMQQFLVGWKRGERIAWRYKEQLRRRRRNSVWTLVLLTGWCHILYYSATITTGAT